MMDNSLDSNAISINRLETVSTNYNDILLNDILTVDNSITELLTKTCYYMISFQHEDSYNNVKFMLLNLVTVVFAQELILDTTDDKVKMFNISMLIRSLFSTSYDNIVVDHINKYVKSGYLMFWYRLVSPLSSIKDYIHYVNTYLLGADVFHKERIMSLKYLCNSFAIILNASRCCDGVINSYDYNNLYRICNKYMNIISYDEYIMHFSMKNVFNNILFFVNNNNTFYDLPNNDSLKLCCSLYINLYMISFVNRLKFSRNVSQFLLDINSIENLYNQLGSSRNIDNNTQSLLLKFSLLKNSKTSVVYDCVDKLFFSCMGNRAAILRDWVNLVINLSYKNKNNVDNF